MPYIRPEPIRFLSIIRSIECELIAIMNRKPLPPKRTERPTCEKCGGNLLALGDQMMCYYCGQISGGSLLNGL